MIVQGDKDLNWHLEQLGLRSMDSALSGFRRIYAGQKCLGDFDVTEAWALVRSEQWQDEFSKVRALIEKRISQIIEASSNKSDADAITFLSGKRDALRWVLEILP